MNYYTVTIKVEYIGDPEILIRQDIDADTPLRALGIMLRECQQIPKALDAVDPKNPYRTPA